jgi:methylated-DNA-protein-cysteine methyltransferase related protein
MAISGKKTISKKKTNPKKKTVSPKKSSPARSNASKKGSPVKTTVAKTPASKKLPIRSNPDSGAKEQLSVVKPSGIREVSFKKDESFFELVHEVARQIPRGRVTSYGAIAACLGTHLSARMVGWAMNTVHLAKKPVPAHRVVNSAGLLTGRHHFNPPEKMQQLLEKEGVTVKNDKVVDFKTLFWNPAQEL